MMTKNPWPDLENEEYAEQEPLQKNTYEGSPMSDRLLDFGLWKLGY